MPTPLKTGKDIRDDHGHLPRDQGTEEEGPSFHKGAWLLQVTAQFSGLLAGLSPQHRSALLWALGKGPEEVPGPGLRMAWYWVKEGNVAPDS